MFISVCHQNLMLSKTKIYFGKNGCTKQFIQNAIDRGNRVAVLHDDGVQGTKIDAKAPRPVFIFFMRSIGEEQGLVLG